MIPSPLLWEGAVRTVGSHLGRIPNCSEVPNTPQPPRNRPPRRPPRRPTQNPPPPPRGLRPTVSWGGGVVGVRNRGFAPPPPPGSTAQKWAARALFPEQSVGHYPYAPPPILAVGGEVCDRAPSGRRVRTTSHPSLPLHPSLRRGIPASPCLPHPFFVVQTMVTPSAMGNGSRFQVITARDLCHSHADHTTHKPIPFDQLYSTGLPARAHWGLTRCPAQHPEPFLPGLKLIGVDGPLP